MKSFENPSLTMHNVTIVTRLRSPNISTKDPKKKNPKEKQTSNHQRKHPTKKITTIITQIKINYPALTIQNL